MHIAGASPNGPNADKVTEPKSSGDTYIKIKSVCFKNANMSSPFSNVKLKPAAEPRSLPCPTLRCLPRSAINLSSSFTLEHGLTALLK